MSELVERLTTEFANKDYAHAYMESHESSRVAAQIKVLREQRGLTQTQLAKLSGMMQERISALEDVDYDAWTIKTLRKLARAFDVHVSVSFVPFSNGILDVASLCRKRLEVEPREADLDQLSKLSIRVDGDGNWKAAAPVVLFPVQVPKGPVHPSQNWQDLPPMRVAL
jgi:transcriptional regulator with XRE-family HTH domain